MLTRVRAAVAKLLCAPSLRLPYESRVPTKTEVECKSSFAAHNPLHILVVDDIPLMHKLVLRQLLDLGYDNVETASDGLEAFTKICDRIDEQRKFDCVLLDIQMPVMDGLQCAQHIVKKAPPSAQPYLIAMSASTFDEDRKVAQESGIQGWLPKPVRRQSLERELSGAYQAHMQLHLQQQQSPT